MGKKKCKEELDEMLQKLEEMGEMATQVLEQVTDKDVKETVMARAAAESFTELMEEEKMSIAACLSSVLLALGKVCKSAVRQGAPYELLHDELLDMVEQLLDEMVAPVAAEMESESNNQN